MCTYLPNIEKDIMNIWSKLHIISICPFNISHGYKLFRVVRPVL